MNNNHSCFLLVIANFLVDCEMSDVSEWMSESGRGMGGATGAVWEPVTRAHSGRCIRRSGIVCALSNHKHGVSVWAGPWRCVKFTDPALFLQTFHWWNTELYGHGFNTAWAGMWPVPWNPTNAWNSCLQFLRYIWIWRLQSDRTTRFSFSNSGEKVL